MINIDSGPYPEGSVVFISFYTPSYKPYGERLLRSLREFKVHFDVRAFQSRKSWNDSVRSKPAFFLRMLKEHPKAKALVWLDADAELRANPEVLFRLKCTMAAPVIHSIKRPEGRFQANTIYMANTLPMYGLLERWIRMMDAAKKETLHCPEQEIFDRLRAEGLGLRFLELPETYAHRLRDTDSTAVIFQHQVSRMHRDPEAWKARMRLRKEKQEKAKGVPLGPRGKILQAAKAKAKTDKDKRE